MNLGPQQYRVLAIAAGAASTLGLYRAARLLRLGKLDEKPIKLRGGGVLSRRAATAIAVVQGAISSLGIALAVYLFTRSF